MKQINNNKGFTLIELVAGLVIMGIITLSLVVAYSQIVKAFVFNIDQAKAVDLSNLEFSIANSLNYNNTTLDNNRINNYLNSGYDVERQVSQVPNTGNNNLKQITVLVYKSGGTSPILSTTTYRAKNTSYDL